MLLQKINNAKNSGQKLLALLIDPDKVENGGLENLLFDATQFGIDFIFFGGSLVESVNIDNAIKKIKGLTQLPIIIFPGSSLQISNEADCILFLSLLSGRNPEYLVGQQVIAAPMLKKSSLEVISTAYLLIDGGRITTANYVSNTLPIPRDKKEISNNTAIAAELFGFSCIYLDAGSGALFEVPADIIEGVAKNVDLPLIVGGGIDSVEKLNLAYQSGADIAVIGTSIETEPKKLKEFCNAKNLMNENSPINN